MVTATLAPLRPTEARAWAIAGGSVCATQPAVGSPEFANRGATSTRMTPKGPSFARALWAATAGEPARAINATRAARRVSSNADIDAISSNDAPKRAPRPVRKHFTGRFE